LLSEVSPKGLFSIFERFRGILQEGGVGKRVQYIIEGLFAVRKGNFEDFPALTPELDLVEMDDQITHEISLEDRLEPQTSLDTFAVDSDFEASEKRYEAIKKEILGDSDSDEDEGEDASGDEGSSSEEEEEEREGEEQGGAPVPPATLGQQQQQQQQQITDMTETDLVNLRRTIYLTIMSALDFEEAGHKLMKIRIPPGKESELSSMIIECCSQERTFIKYYGLLAQRFCYVNRIYQDCFIEAFCQQYETIHRLETNKLRNVAKLFALLLVTDGIPWSVLGIMKITEEDTTSSSRIFIKILFQELAGELGLGKLNERLQEPAAVQAGWFDGIFPKDLPKNTRFSINFFTSIGLGGLTDEMRTHLKNLPKTIMQSKPPAPAKQADSGSYSYSYSDSGSYSYSYSYSDSADSKRSGSYSYSYSYSDSPGDKKKK